MRGSRASRDESKAKGSVVLSLCVLTAIDWTAVGRVGAVSGPASWLRRPGGVGVGRLVNREM